MGFQFGKCWDPEVSEEIELSLYDDVKEFADYDQNPITKGQYVGIYPEFIGIIFRLAYSTKKANRQLFDKYLNKCEESFVEQMRENNFYEMHIPLNHSKVQFEVDVDNLKLDVKTEFVKNSKKYQWYD